MVEDTSCRPRRSDAQIDADKARHCRPLRGDLHGTAAWAKDEGGAGCYARHRTHHIGFGCLGTARANDAGRSVAPYTIRALASQ